MDQREEKRNSKVLSSKRFADAFRGIGVFVATTRHIYVHIVCGLVVFALGYYFKISGLEWIALVFAVGLVLVTEAVNTAIEIDIDLTSPEYHPYARDTKDVAAGAVLLAVVVAVIVGIIIFGPKVGPMLGL